MRICFLGSFSAGGTENACFKVANILANNNEVYVLSTSKDKKTFFLHHSIQFFNLVSCSVIKNNIEVYQFLKKNKIDIIITLEAMTGIISLLPGKVSGCKHIIWEHANYHQNQGSKYIQQIRMLELKIADAYVVLTERDLKNFRENYNPKAMMDCIYNIAEGGHSVHYDLSSKTIISVGHIRKIKNFILIPEIGKHVFSKHGDWQWKIYGTTGGEEYERILAKVREYGLEKNIVFHGRCDNMKEEYPKASMCVMTSLQEGLPMVLLEAKTHGLPIVSFDIETGPSEIIRDYVNGFLVPPYNVQIMAERICDLIENEKMRKNFSDNSGLDLWKFDAKTVLKKWDNLLKNVTGVK